MAYTKNECSPDFKEDSMSVFDWRAFLEQWSQAILQSPEVEYFDLPKTAIKTKWLGFDGATEAQIVEVETKLGTKLPPSYRAFLKVSNGWRNTGTFIDRILPVEEIHWFRDTPNPSLIDHANLYISQMTSVPYDPEYDEADYNHFMDTLVIAEPTEEEELYLLNPKVKNKAGEWQAWAFAHWIPGVEAFDSFQALLENEYDSVRHEIEYDSNHLSHKDDKPTLIKKLNYLITLLETDIAQCLTSVDGMNVDSLKVDHQRQVAEGIQEVLDKITTIRDSEGDAPTMYQQLINLTEEYAIKPPTNLSFDVDDDDIEDDDNINEVEEAPEPDIFSAMIQMLENSLHMVKQSGHQLAIAKLYHMLNR